MLYWIVVFMWRLVKQSRMGRIKLCLQTINDYKPYFELLRTIMRIITYHLINKSTSYNDNSSNDTIKLQLLFQHLTLQFLSIRTEQLIMTALSNSYVSSISKCISLINNDIKLLTTINNLIYPLLPRNTDYQCYQS